MLTQLLPKKGGKLVSHNVFLVKKNTSSSLPLTSESIFPVLLFEISPILLEVAIPPIVIMVNYTRWTGEEKISDDHTEQNVTTYVPIDHVP